MPLDIVINFKNEKEVRQYENSLKMTDKQHKSVNEKIIDSKDSNGLHKVYDIKMFKIVSKDDPRIMEEARTEYHAHTVLSTLPTHRKNDCAKIVIEPRKPKRVIEDIDELLDDVTSKINENNKTIQCLSEHCKREKAPTSYTECIRNSNQRIELAKKFDERFNVSLVASPRNSLNCIAYLKSQVNLMSENKKWEIFKSINSHEGQSVITDQDVPHPVSSLREKFENKMKNNAIVTPSVPLEPRRSSISSIRRKPSIPTASDDDTNCIKDVYETNSSKVYSSSPLNIHTMNMRIGRGEFVRDDDESNMPLRDREFLDAAIELKKKQNVRGYPVNTMAFINENDIQFRESVYEQVKNLTHIKGTKRILNRNKKSLNLAIEQCRVKGRKSIDMTTNIIGLWREYIQYLLYEQSKMVSELKRREFHLPYTLEKRFQQYLTDTECLPLDALKGDNYTFMTQISDKKNGQTDDKKSHNLSLEGRVIEGESMGISDEISTHHQTWHADILQKVKKRISPKNNVYESQELPESMIDLLFIVKELLHACVMDVIEFTSKDFFDIIRLGVRHEVDFRDDSIFEIIMNIGNVVGVSLEEIYKFYESNQFGFPALLVTSLRKYRQNNNTSDSFDRDASISSLTKCSLHCDSSLID